MKDTCKTSSYLKKCSITKIIKDSSLLKQIICNLANIDVIKANKQMSEQIKGKPRKVTELRDGSLLVEVSNEQQSKLIQSIVKLDETKVTVS